jgi:thiamine pyrophosphate-dependent acetolactate synthase large subunit-like protein
VIRNGAQAVWESLVSEGIDVVFGVLGGSVILCITSWVTILFASS